MDEELLINLVRGYKELYDLQDDHYDDHQRRDKIWKEIGAIMKESAQNCRDRWRRIRDNYRRAKKLRKLKSDTNMKKAKYEDLLSFLNVFNSNDDETFSNNQPMNVSQDSSNEDSSLLDPLLEETHSRDSTSAGTARISVRKHPHSSEDSAPRTCKRNCSSLDTPPQLPPTHLLLQEYNLENNYINKKSKSEKIVDFFKNLGETVSTFPEDVQICVKRDVFKIVTDAEEMVFMEKFKPECVYELSEETQKPDQCTLVPLPIPLPSPSLPPQS